MNRVLIELTIAGQALVGMKARVPFRSGFLQRPTVLVAFFRLWQFFRQSRAAEWRPPASRRSEQCGHRSRFGCRTKCGSLGWWFLIWNCWNDCRSVCPAFFQLFHPQRPEPPTRKRRRAGPSQSFRGRLKLHRPAPRRSTPSPNTSPIKRGTSNEPLPQ